MIDSPRKFRWLQFGLKTLLALMLLSAVVLSVVQQRKQAAQAAVLNERNRQLEQDMRRYEEAFQYHVALQDLYSALDHNIAEHRDVYRSARHAVRICGEAFTAPVQRRRINDVDPHMEVIVFQANYPYGGSIAVLLVDERFVDHLNSCPRSGVEWKQQDDGTTCLAYTENGLGSGLGLGLSREEPQEHLFAITEAGFERVGGRRPRMYFGLGGRR